MVRGEIYFGDPFPRSGAEQSGRRPFIVVSDNAFNSAPAWRSVTVVPLSSSPRWQEPGPTVVHFRAGECGLPKACSAVTHQITTLDRSKLTAPPVGRLTPEKERELAAALRNYLDL